MGNCEFIDGFLDEKCELYHSKALYGLEALPLEYKEKVCHNDGYFSEIPKKECQLKENLEYLIVNSIAKQVFDNLSNSPKNIQTPKAISAKVRD